MLTKKAIEEWGANKTPNSLFIIQNVTTSYMIQIIAIGMVKKLGGNPVMRIPTSERHNEHILTAGFP